MADVPDAYYQFIIDYAPYLYYIPGSGVDTESGRAALAAAFAIDFLYQAYNDPQFESKKSEIKTKVEALADFILTQQYMVETDPGYGGFKSTETSTKYYSVDACRCIPSLLRAYELIEKSTYLDAAKLAGATFLYTMQHKPSEIGLHDKYYGGFVRAWIVPNQWYQQMDVECLYGLIGLRMLCDYDPDNKTKYETMISDAVGFLREGLEGLWLYFNPPGLGDGNWHRVGLNEEQIYDDPFAYALYGLYDYEGWTPSCRGVYQFINSIKADAEHPAYQPNICWSGYLDVENRLAACEYYDSVTSGILWRIRTHHDKPALQYSKLIIDKYQDEFMFWGPKHKDYSPIENKQSIVVVSWLSLFYLKYQEPQTTFTQILNKYGEEIKFYYVKEISDKVYYGDPVKIQASVSLTRIEEILFEPGYVIDDYITIYTFAPIRHHDKILYQSGEYEILTVQSFRLKTEPFYFKGNCRRLLT